MYSIVVFKKTLKQLPVPSPRFPRKKKIKKINTTTGTIQSFPTSSEARGKTKMKDKKKKKQNKKNAPLFKPVLGLSVVFFMLPKKKKKNET